MAVKTTLNLDEAEYREAQRMAAAAGMSVSEYASRALRDARLRSWHRTRADRGAELPESLADADELEREPRQ